MSSAASLLLRRATSPSRPLLLLHQPRWLSSQRPPYDPEEAKGRRFVLVALAVCVSASAIGSWVMDRIHQQTLEGESKPNKASK